MLARVVLISLAVCAVSQARILKRSYGPSDFEAEIDIARDRKFILPSIGVQVQPTIANQQYCYYGLPGLKPAYIITEEGFVYYLINGQLVLAQGITTTGTSGQVTTGEVKTSSGGLLSFLGKPLDAVGDIISKTHDVASGVVNLPFEAGRQVISGVGLDDTLIGNVATGVLDIGEGIEQTKLGLLAGAAELPFRLAADVAYAVDKE